MTLEQLLADLDARRGLHPGHRRPHLRGRSPPSRLHRRHHPGRPRRQEPGPRRRPQTPTATPKPCASPWPCATAAAPPKDCETPPGLCHAHHDTPWSHGGRTNVDTGRLLCPHHHRRIHDPHYETHTAAQRQGQLPPTRVTASGSFCVRPCAVASMAAKRRACSSRMRQFLGDVLIHQLLKPPPAPPRGQRAGCVMLSTTAATARIRPGSCSGSTSTP